MLILTSAQYSVTPKSSILLFGMTPIRIATSSEIYKKTAYRPPIGRKPLPIKGRFDNYN